MIHHGLTTDCQSGYFPAANLCPHYARIGRIATNSFYVKVKYGRWTGLVVVSVIDDDLCLGQALTQLIMRNVGRLFLNGK